MKIKLKFTEEHIALIKALKFERIDFEEILKSFSQYDNIVKFTDDNGVQIQGRLSDVLDKYHISVDSIYGIDNYNLWEVLIYGNKLHILLEYMIKFYQEHKKTLMVLNILLKLWNI